MRHFMDKQGLPKERGRGEIIAINISQRVEMNVATRGHGNLARLKKSPFAATDGNLGIINRAAKHGAGEVYLARAQRPLPTDGAGLRLLPIQLSLPHLRQLPLLGLLPLDGR